MAPGEQWKGELVIRHHEKYWEVPIFDRDSPQPMPKLVTQKDDADDRWGSKGTVMLPLVGAESHIGVTYGCTMRCPNCMCPSAYVLGNGGSN